MGLLGNYQSFKEDIETTFKELIAEFHLELTEPYDGTFLLTGEKCIIRIIYDRGELGCMFKEISDEEINPGYEVWSVYRLLYPTREPVLKQSNGDWGPPKEILTAYSEIIQSEFTNILNGDFSWVPDYGIDQNKEARLMVFVLGLERTHPIFKKFLSGDTTWRIDAENHLAQNTTKPRDANKSWFRKLWR
jgi:hypothetical protein